MTNEKKLTTVGQMQNFAQRQDARDDAQDQRIQQMDEENDLFLKYSEQALTDSQKAQARQNIGASEEGHTHASITNEQIDAILES